jgi:hypothetical protein
MTTLSLIAKRGDTGNTTLSIYLAVRARLDGLRVLLLNLGAPASASGYDLAVIGTAPHSAVDSRACASRSDRAGIPTRPAILQLNAIGATTELAAGLGVKGVDPTQLPLTPQPGRLPFGPVGRGGRGRIGAPGRGRPERHARGPAIGGRLPWKGNRSRARIEARRLSRRQAPLPGVTG